MTLLTLESETNLMSIKVYNHYIDYLRMSLSHKLDSEGDISIYTESTSFITGTVMEAASQIDCPASLQSNFASLEKRKKKKIQIIKPERLQKSTITLFFKINSFQGR